VATVTKAYLWWTIDKLCLHVVSVTRVPAAPAAAAEAAVTVGVTVENVMRNSAGWRWV